MARQRKSQPDLFRTFIRRLAPMLLLAMLVWGLLRPALDTAVSASAQVLIRAFEYPRVTRLVATEHRAEVRRTDLTTSKVPTVALTEVHFNTIVLLALFLSLPGPLSRHRLERLFMGWCVLLLTQTLNLVFHVKCIYAFDLGQWSLQSYSELARNVYGFLRYFTDLPGRFSFPFLIWLGFSWDRLSGLISGETPGAARSGTTRQRKRRDQRSHVP
jgi:hypothetical protein